MLPWETTNSVGLSRIHREEYVSIASIQKDEDCLHNRAGHLFLRPDQGSYARGNGRCAAQLLSW